MRSFTTFRLLRIGEGKLRGRLQESPDRASGSGLLLCHGQGAALPQPEMLSGERLIANWF